MIRRVASAVVIAALAVGGVLLREPTQPVDLGTFPDPVAPPHRGCLGVVERDATVLLEVGSIVRGPVVAGLAAGPSGPEAVEFGIDEAGGGMVALDELGAAGVSGALVELPAIDAAAAVSSIGPGGLWASTCTAPGTGRLVVSGGSTGTGETLDLLITNPYAQDAVVGVRGASEVGIDSVAALEEIIVPAGSTISRSLDAELDLRTSLTTTIEVRTGAVHAAYLQRTENDVSITEAVEPLADWWLPWVPVGEAPARMVIANESAVAVDVQVDRVADGTVEEALTVVSVPGSEQIELTVGDLAEGPAGFRVSGTGPIGVTLVVDAGGRRGATPAVPAIGTDWLIPGVGGVGGRLWVTNPGDVPAELVIQPLAPDTPARATNVGPGTTTSIQLDRLGSGQLVRSSSPVATLWFAGNDDGILLASPVVVEAGER